MLLARTLIAYMKGKCLDGFTKIRYGWMVRLLVDVARQNLDCIYER